MGQRERLSRVIKLRIDRCEHWNLAAAGEIGAGKPFQYQSGVGFGHAVGDRPSAVPRHGFSSH